MKYPKLPKAFKRKWVAALRSGNYKQGSGELLCDGKYCCLGVAGRVCGMRQESIRGCTIFSQGLGVYAASPSKHLPQCLVVPEGENKLVKSLAGKNDSGKWSFKRIATWIEKHL